MLGSECNYSADADGQRRPRRDAREHLKSPPPEQLPEIEPVEIIAWSWTNVKQEVGRHVFGLLSGLGGLYVVGSACIQHLALRIILSRANCIPWRYVHFLDYAAAHLLRKVGGGYIFAHRLLQDYFASLG